MIITVGFDFLPWQEMKGKGAGPEVVVITGGPERKLS